MIVEPSGQACGATIRGVDLSAALASMHAQEDLPRTNQECKGEETKRGGINVEWIALRDQRAARDPLGSAPFLFGPRRMRRAPIPGPPTQIRQTRSRV